MDTIITGGTVVLEQQIRPLTIGIEAGKVVALLAPDQPMPKAGETIDAAGLTVVPGAVDAHTHFTGAHDDHAEIEAGTRGAAKAGVTTVIEMPHSNPPAVTLEHLIRKRDAMAARAVVDFALWGGLNGRNLDQLPRLHDAGAVAMKGFMCSSRADGEAGDARGLAMLDDDALYRAMGVIAGLGGVIGLHAENHPIMHGRLAELQSQGRSDPRAHAEAQPEICETEAVARAIHLARATGVHCHIVHLSTAAAAEFIDAARPAACVTVETCPQYLVLDEEDLVRIGGKARCGPPIRRRATVEALWRHVLGGRIDALASDHCPYPPPLKAGGPIWDAAMGLTGIETATPLFYGAAVGNRGMSLLDFARMTATGPARIFGLYGRKGAIALGFDADLVVMDPAARGRVDATGFEGDAKWSAFDGMSYRGAVRRTLVRGRTVYADGRLRAEPGSGRFVHRLAVG